MLPAWRRRGAQAVGQWARSAVGSQNGHGECFTVLKAESLSQMACAALQGGSQPGYRDGLGMARAFRIGATS